MHGRELVKATLEFRNYSDRAPRHIWSLPWVYMFEQKNCDAIYAKYEWDIGTVYTEYSEKSPVEKGDPYLLGEYTDQWGCRYKNIQPGMMGEVKEPLISPDDSEWEDTSRIVIPENLLSFDIAQVNAECGKYDQFFFADCCPKPFEQLQFIRGTENLYMDLIERPSNMMAFMEKMHDFYCRLLTKWAQTDVDALYIMDDWGSQRSLLINPKTWRELFKPMYRDYINIAHKHGKKIFMHSDGYILDILPDLIEMGLDAINSQIFCMGPENLAPFRGKITFWGEICRQNILPNGSVADVENAVRSVYDNLWENGGCIAHCEYGPGMPFENIDAVFSTWNKLTEGR